MHSLTNCHCDHGVVTAEDILKLQFLSLSADSGDIEFRLSEGAGANMGRLQVHYNGAWGRVCEAGFGRKEALVACRNFGFESVLRLTRRYGQ